MQRSAGETGGVAPVEALMVKTENMIAVKPPYRERVARPRMVIWGDGERKYHFSGGREKKHRRHLRSDVKHWSCHCDLPSHKITLPPHPRI